VDENISTSNIFLNPEQDPKIWEQFYAEFSREPTVEGRHKLWRQLIDSSSVKPASLDDFLTELLDLTIDCSILYRLVMCKLPRKLICVATRLRENNAIHVKKLLGIFFLVCGEDYVKTSCRLTDVHNYKTILRQLYVFENMRLDMLNSSLEHCNDRAVFDILSRLVQQNQVQISILASIFENIS